MQRCRGSRHVQTKVGSVHQFALFEKDLCPGSINIPSSVILECEQPGSSLSPTEPELTSLEKDLVATQTHDNSQQIMMIPEASEDSSLCETLISSGPTSPDLFVPPRPASAPIPTGKRPAQEEVGQLYAKRGQKKGQTLP